MENTLLIEGSFYHENDLPVKEFEDLFNKIQKMLEESKRRIHVFTCNVKNKQVKLYLDSIDNCFPDDEYYGQHFNGTLCIDIKSEKQIHKLAENDFIDIEIDSMEYIDIKGIKMCFSPEQWLY